MVAITQIVASLVAITAVQALPQPQVTQPSANPEPAAPAAPSGSDLFQILFSAPTAIARFKALLTSGDSLLPVEALRKMTVFDFNAAEPAEGANGGAAITANIESFPILTGQGISTTVAFLEPCGINTPHIHPRRAEFLTLVEGSNLKFGYVLENGLVKSGSQEIAGYLTVFPMGSIHFQFNDNCEPATFVASLNSEDPGTSQVAQGFFALDFQALNATLAFPQEINEKNFEEFKDRIPANLAQDVGSCLVKCSKR